MNSAGGLDACLESLKDFSEIIICDGNSTDNTVEIAKAHGAKVIRQYETDELELPCVKDKANMRQRNMEQASNEWYFFMDADDSLSEEVVEEIRRVVTDSNPSHLVWRMPTRIFLDGKEVKHEATYPSYQVRLFNMRINPKFRGEVHDRVVFDSAKYPVGTLNGYYNFFWSKERISNLWAYFSRYADWELETMQLKNVWAFIYWGLYRRIKIILGYVVWRLPRMYARYGFKDSMPLWIELTIVRYNVKILLGTIKDFFLKNVVYIYIRETLKGKDLNRTLSNLSVREKECYGKAIDIGGGTMRASHYRFLKITKWFRLTTVDISKDAKPDIVINLENEKLPLADNLYDVALAFNVLEHLSRRREILEEVRRILKPGGELVGVIPFLVNVHPDPNDYTRLTYQGLAELFKESGFSEWEIKSVGLGPFTAGYYQSEFVWPRLVRLFLAPVAMLLDTILDAIKPSLGVRSKFPLSYVFYVKK